ncbi:TetR/AcrR family transcriptional regulator C-terminal domain-containing protein, partial [Dactylosporangium sp. NPDC005572]|uniref:TetR/AcrR family transcriptional regulator C-terminal domain-containing protein n=1 Tax=Dactylosporangium sp. NPDC005572 TaxID=3156889 RepID=UPI0033B3D4C5
VHPASSKGRQCEHDTAGSDPEAALAAAIAAPLARHGERFPQLLAALAETAAAGAGDQAFEFGLALLLDGLAARIRE